MPKRFKKPKTIGKQPSTLTLPYPFPFKITAGFPEFWNKVHDHYPRFFEVIDDLQALVNRILEHRVSGKLGKVIYFNAAITANSFGALVTLALNGYGHDATRIARGIYEAAVNALYLQRHPDEVQDFIDFYWVKSKKLYDYLKKLTPEVFEKIPPEKFAELLSEYDRVKDRFDNGHGKIRNDWCKKTLRQRAEEVDYGQYYPTFYAMASGIHHGDITGLVNQSASNALIVSSPPSFDGIKRALLLAHNSLILAFRVLSEISSLGLEAEFAKAEEGFRKAWRGIGGE